MNRWLVAIAIFSACSSSQASQLDANVVDAAKTLDIAGAWQFAPSSTQSGEQLSYLELDADGTGAVYSLEPTLGIRGCVSMSYVVADDVLTITRGAYGTHANNRAPHPVAANSGLDGALHVIQLTADTLVLTDADGSIYNFSRATSLVDAVCHALTPARSIATSSDYPIASGNTTGLGADDTGVWYFSSNQASVVHVVPATSATDAPLQNQTTLLTTQGDTLWEFACCTPSMASVAQDGAALATFDLQIPLGTDADLYGAAFDGDSDAWLLGWIDGAATQPVLLDIDLTTTPPTTKSTTMLPLALSFNYAGIAFFNAHVWIIGSFVTPVLIKFDPVSMTAVETYSLPALSNGKRYANGLTVFGADFYTVVSDDNAATQSLIKLSIP